MNSAPRRAALKSGKAPFVAVPAVVGAAALLIGAVAGLLPAIRAARLSPTQALWSL